MYLFKYDLGIFCDYLVFYNCSINFSNRLENIKVNVVEF